MLVESLIVAGLVVLVLNIIVRQTGRFGVACVIAGLSFFLGFPCLGLPAVQLNALVLVVAGLVCWFTKAGPRVFLLCSLGAFFISHGVGGWVAYALIREQAELRQEYAPESLAERLAYEKELSVHARGDATFTAPRNTRSDRELTGLEDLVEYQMQRATPRTFRLKQLHEGAVEDFINSPGFGVTRRIRPRREYIELPEGEPIPLPAASNPAEAKKDVEADKPSPPSESDKLTTVPLQTALQEMHQDSVIDFANPKGFGYVRDRDHVAGFQSHRFGAMPELDDRVPETRRWRIEKLELVSLLTHDEPAVYLSDHLPRMDELRGAPTRALTPFEKTALGALEQGENLKVEGTTDHIRMVGSIRALKQCTSCHSVERGALLGAFSYVLQRHAGPE
jgi:hypothetical protein